MTSSNNYWVLYTCIFFLVSKYFEWWFYEGANLGTSFFVVNHHFVSMSHAGKWTHYNQ